MRMKNFLAILGIRYQKIDFFVGEVLEGFKNAFQIHGLSVGNRWNSRNFMNDVRVLENVNVLCEL